CSSVYRIPASSNTQTRPHSCYVYPVPSAPPPCLRGTIKPTFYFFLLPWISSTVILKGFLPPSAVSPAQILKHPNTLLHLVRVLRILCASSVSQWLNITNYLRTRSPFVSLVKPSCTSWLKNPCKLGNHNITPSGFFIIGLF